MAGFIWTASGENPVEIQVNLDNSGLGWFTLAAITADGGATDLRRLDAADADGDAMYRATPNDDLIFKLQIFCANAQAASANVFLRVTQNTQMLECKDYTGKVLNSTHGQLGPVKLGSVDPTKAFVQNFEIWE